MVSIRIKYLDVVKCIAIYLVVWGHVLYYFDHTHKLGATMVGIIYSFHMPLFMLISGYFFSSSLKKPFKDFILGKTMQLIVPAITWTILTCIYLVIIHNGDAIIGEIIGNSWFLKTLFMSYVVLYSLVKLKVNKFFILVVCLLFFLLPRASFLQFNWLFPFFVFGFFINDNQRILSARPSIIILLLTTTVFLFYVKYVFNVQSITINMYSVVHQPLAIIIRYILALSASFTIILITKYYCEKDNIITNSCANIGKFTLGIYLIQSLFLEKIISSYMDFADINVYLFNYVISPVLSLLFVVLCVVLMNNINSKVIKRLFFCVN